MSNDLVTENAGRARHLARLKHRRCPPCITLDELTADALFGLFEAARKYDPARGVSFASFAARKIVWAIQTGLRQADPFKRRRSDPSRARPAARVLHAGDRALPDRRTPAPWQRAQTRDLGRTARQALHPWERVLIVLYYHEGLNMKEIGRVLGCTESWVSAVHADCLARMRDRLRGLEEE